MPKITVKEQRLADMRQVFRDKLPKLKLGEDGQPVKGADGDYERVARISRHKAQMDRLYREKPESFWKLMTHLEREVRVERLERAARRAAKAAGEGGVAGPVYPADLPADVGELKVEDALNLLMGRFNRDCPDASV